MLIQSTTLSTPSTHANPARMRAILVPVLTVWLLGLAATAQAQSVVSVSPDVTIALGAADVGTKDDAVAVANDQGIVVLADIGSIPESADLIGYGELVGGAKLLSFDTTVALSGGVVARPGDVVAWDGSLHSVLFDATAAGLPRGVRTDAVSLAVNGLLLSFDTDVTLPGSLTVADEDLVRWDGTTFSLAFDGSAAGLDRALDIDAADDLGSNYFLISFETAGSVGGVAFQDEDVLRYANGSWSLELEPAALDGDWTAADLDAMQVPEPTGFAAWATGVSSLIGVARIRRRTRPE